LDLHATLFAFLLAIALFGSMLLFLELGWRFGVRQMAKHGTLRVREWAKQMHQSTRCLAFCWSSHSLARPFASTGEAIWPRNR
jgi:hypothetical protein